MTKTIPVTYAFCETASAFAKGPNHVRKLSTVGLLPSGGADTVALCGTTVAWDVAETTLENAISVNFTCRSCAEKARELA